VKNTLNKLFRQIKVATFTVFLYNKPTEKLSPFVKSENVMLNYSQEQLELKAFLINQQAENVAKAKALGGFYMGHVDDLDHWAESNVYNIEQYQHYDALATHRDVYKDINGFKPSWTTYSAMSTEQIHDEIDSLFDEDEEDSAREVRYLKEEQARIATNKHENRYRPNNAFSGLKMQLALVA
jgi:tRNA splicing ligase